MASGHPSGLPELFLDRSLGRHQVPHALRAAGLTVRTLAEEYGIPEMAARYLAVIDDIAAACREPGPFLYAVTAHELRRVLL